MSLYQSHISSLLPKAKILRKWAGLPRSNGATHSLFTYLSPYHFKMVSSRSVH